MNVALLIIDMQKLYINSMKNRESVETAIEHINYVADILRKLNQPVVLIQDMESYSDERKEEFETIDEIIVSPNDVHLQKIHSNSFWETELEKILRDRDVGFVIVTGFSAEYCVLFTYQGAKERGFKAAILKDAILSKNEDTVIAAYRDREIISYSAVEYFLSQGIDK